MDFLGFKRSEVFSSLGVFCSSAKSATDARYFLLSKIYSGVLLFEAETEELSDEFLPNPM